jgi:hypothetical protein
LQVKSEVIGFSDFDEKQALIYLGIYDKTTFVIDDNEFSPAALDLDSAVTGYPDQTIRDLLDQTALNLHQRIRLFTPLEMSTEYTRRELISPILVAATLIAAGVGLRAEHTIKGRRGRGPIDYAVLFKEFCVLLSEAKTHEKLLNFTGQARAGTHTHQGLCFVLEGKKIQIIDYVIDLLVSTVCYVQALAQLQASREEFANTFLNKKRKYEEIVEFAKACHCFDKHDVVSVGAALHH